MELMRRRIRFNHSRSFDFFNLCYYLSKNEQPDEDQKRVLNFKRANTSAIRFFVVEAINNLRHFGFVDDVIIAR